MIQMPYGGRLLRGVKLGLTPEQPSDAVAKNPSAICRSPSANAPPGPHPETGEQLHRASVPDPRQSSSQAFRLGLPPEQPSHDGA
jgi:hypothetical protein